MQSPSLISSLEAFLQQPNIEVSPAWELIGHPQQKPIPTFYHSRLQRNLVPLRGSQKSKVKSKK